MQPETNKTFRDEKRYTSRILPSCSIQGYVQRACVHHPFLCQHQETIDIEGVTYPLVKVEISNTSHPFYTGKMKLVDTAGRVDKFYQRYKNRQK